MNRGYGFGSRNSSTNCSSWGGQSSSRNFKSTERLNQTQVGQSNGNVYGQRQANPFVLGQIQSFGGIHSVMNPETSWTSSHNEFRSTPGVYQGSNKPIGAARKPAIRYPQCAQNGQFRRGEYLNAMGRDRSANPINRSRSYPSKPTTNRARSTQSSHHQMYNQQQSSSPSPPITQMPIPEGQGTSSVITGNLPAELQNNPNVNYVNLKWEDILGGNGGLDGLKISMAPPVPGMQNRQIRIGMAGEQIPNDGSTPLKLVSFQPVENIPGKSNGNNKPQVASASQFVIPNHKIQESHPNTNFQAPRGNNLYTSASATSQRTPRMHIPGYTGHVGRY